MFVDISVKMLIPSPLIRNIICHNNLLLMGKPKMSDIILTFPGMQPTRNKTKMSVCASSHTLSPVWVGMPPHCDCSDIISSHSGWHVACQFCFHSGVQGAFFLI